MYSQFRLSGKLLAATIALVLMVSIAAFVIVLPFDSKAAAGSPNWEEGDGVAAGVELDVLQLYNDYENNVTEMMEMIVTYMSDGNGTLDDFSVTKGAIKAYVMIGVTDVSDEEVTVTERIGFEIQFKVNAKLIVSDMPKTGTAYNISDGADLDDLQMSDLELDEDKDLENITTLMSFEIRIGFTQAFSVTFDKDTMDVKEVSFSLRPSMMINTQISKLPWIGEPVDNTAEVKYGSFNVFFKSDVKSTLTLGFLPPLKLFDLPMEVDDSWNTTTDNISIDLKFEGIIDMQITGTHEMIAEGNEEIDQMFNNITESMPNATGLDEFPIVIEQVTIPAEYFASDDAVPTVEEDDGPFADMEFEIVNGAFPTEMIEVPMQIVLNCTEVGETDLLVKHGLRSENSSVYWFWPDGQTVPGVIPNIPLANYTGGLHANVTNLYVGGLPYIADMGNFTMWDDKMSNTMEGMEEGIVATVETMTGGTVNMSESFKFQTMTLSSVNDGIDSIESTQDSIATSSATEEEGSLLDFFLEPPYIGSIVVVLVVVILGLMVARKG